MPRAARNRGVVAVLAPVGRRARYRPSPGLPLVAAGALLVAGALLAVALPPAGVTILTFPEPSGGERGSQSSAKDGPESSPSGAVTIPATVVIAGTPAPTESVTASAVTTAREAGDLTVALASATAVAQARLDRTFAAYLASRKGAVAVMAVDTRTGVVVTAGARKVWYTASVVKLDILAVLLLQRQDQGRLPTAAERTLARRMITASDNDAASTLWRRIGGASGLATANRRAFAVRLLEQVIDGQAWGVSAAGCGSGTALKNGWLPYSKDGYRWLVNSVGRIRTTRGSTVLVVVLTRRSPSLAYGVATVERVSRLAVEAIEET